MKLGYKVVKDMARLDELKWQCSTTQLKDAYRVEYYATKNRIERKGIEVVEKRCGIDFMVE